MGLGVGVRVRGAAELADLLNGLDDADLVVDVHHLVRVRARVRLRVRVRVRARVRVNLNLTR